jgi:hypothetical protein
MDHTVRQHQAVSLLSIRPLHILIITAHHIMDIPMRIHLHQRATLYTMEARTCPRRMRIIIHTTILLIHTHMVNLIVRHVTVIVRRRKLETALPRTNITEVMGIHLQLGPRGVGTTALPSKGRSLLVMTKTMKTTNDEFERESVETSKQSTLLNGL